VIDGKGKVVEPNAAERSGGARFDFTATALPGRAVENSSKSKPDEVILVYPPSDREVHAAGISSLKEVSSISRLRQGELLDWTRGQISDMFVMARNMHYANVQINLMQAFPDARFFICYAADYWKQVGVADFPGYFIAEMKRLGLGNKVSFIRDDSPVRDSDIDTPWGNSWIRDCLLNIQRKDGTAVMLHNGGGLLAETFAQLRNKAGYSTITGEIFSTIEGGAMYPLGDRLLLSRRLLESHLARYREGAGEGLAPQGPELVEKYKDPLTGRVLTKEQALLQVKKDYERDLGMPVLVVNDGSEGLLCSSDHLDLYMLPLPLYENGKRLVLFDSPALGDEFVRKGLKNVVAGMKVEVEAGLHLSVSEEKNSKGRYLYQGVFEPCVQEEVPAETEAKKDREAAHAQLLKDFAEAKTWMEKNGFAVIPIPLFGAVSFMNGFVETRGKNQEVVVTLRKYGIEEAEEYLRSELKKRGVTVQWIRGGQSPGAGMGAADHCLSSEIRR
jgi:hypothetical protein